jgi:hypothetical protein
MPMKRREFLGSTGLGGAILSLVPGRAPTESQHEWPFFTIGIELNAPGGGAMRTALAR